MKKLLFILFAIFLSFAMNAQQTEDEIYIGKGKTFGNYNGADTKPIDGQKTITGLVTGICKRDCCNNKRTFCSVDLKNDNGIITVGTRDYGFTVPREIEGHTITVEGKDAGQISGGRKRRDVKKDAQQDIQFAATGIKIID